MNVIHLLAASGVLGATLVAAAQPPVKAPEPIKMPELDLTKPTLFMVGYAHLDTQWRWTYVETIREYIPNTLKDNFTLFEKYPEYIFNFSGSRRYRMMEEYYPADFERLKGYVAAGKWFPCGSSVDENDANVPSAESLVRQVLYGNKYFRQTFGVASEEYMLPDCFGFPAALPSVLAHCGVKGFSTQKLTWNAVIPIPFKFGMWYGPDGKGLMSCLDPESYSADAIVGLESSEKWLNRINATGKASGAFVDYHYHGVGDVGGAPRERSVQRVQAAVNGKGPIKVLHSQADWIFKMVTPEMQEHLPNYKGELELVEHSSGSISSQAYMKRWNRKNELLADAAERAAVAGWWLSARQYPATRLEDAWYLVLGSQMHDILPGTSVPRAYDLSWNDEVIAANQFGQVLTEGAGIVISAMDTRGAGTSIVVFNPLSFEREDVVEAEIPTGQGKAPAGARATGPDGKAIAAQVLSIDGGVARVAFLAKAPSVGFATYSVELLGEPAAASAALKVAERQLENDAYIVKLDDHGDVSSIFDKQAKREMLSAPIRLGLHYENPRQWPAWNQDWADREKPARAFAGAEGPVTFKVVENGPARVAVEVTRQAEGSTFTQRIRLGAGGAAGRVEFDTAIDWRTKERSVRAWFPLTAANPIATYDIQTGVIERPNSSAKMFEYSFHQWFDLTDVSGSHGGSVLCDSKYAADKPDDRTVRLTLLHTPGVRGGYPDQATQDLGKHRVLYAFVGHSGDWRVGTPAQAARLNQPLVPFRASADDGALGKSFSMLRINNPNVAILTVKKAEDSDEVVVRLRELSGSKARGVRIAAATPIAAAREVDGQERPIGAATLEGGELVTDIHGYGLRAFAVKLNAPASRIAPLHQTSLAVPYNADVVSTNAKRADGNFNGRGASLPAEQFPKVLILDGVNFVFGTARDSTPCAMTCTGQSVSIPPPAALGAFDRLYLIAAADEDVTASIEVDGKAVPWKVQAFNGMVGQWDCRTWPLDERRGNAPRYGRETTGLVPGFIKPDPIAWYCSHYHTPEADTIYEYAYLFKYTIEIPAGVMSVKLPNDPRVKIFAASVARVGTAGAVAAAPLFDTLADHVQDAPRVVAPAGVGADAATVQIEPGLYWRSGSVRYTLDGSEPGANSSVYAGPITLASTTTVKAAVVSGGRAGPVAATKIEVNDRTPPSIKSASMSGADVLTVAFSEPVSPASATAEHFAVEPAIAVKMAQLSADGRSVSITLAAAPASNTPYRVLVKGVKDTSPAGNVLSSGQAAFQANSPVFSMAEVKAEAFGTSIKDTPGLPTKGSDAWSINVFVRSERAIPPRTLIVGFGKLENLQPGNGRYLARFANGAHFWSHNQDVPSSAAISQRRWTMLTATYDGKTARLYVNGESVGERAVELSDDDNEIQIAPTDPWEHQRKFEGELRGLTIWKTALSEEAVKALYAASPSGGNR